MKYRFDRGDGPFETKDPLRYPIGRNVKMALLRWRRIDDLTPNHSFIRSV